MKVTASWRRGLGWSGALILMLFGIASAVSPTSNASQTKTDSWHQKMRAIELTFQELLIDLSSSERFNNPKNFKKIEKNAEKFSKFAHELTSNDTSSPDADPSIQLIASQFAQEANHAYKTLTWGHRAYARSLLKSMTGYCIACHTRSKGSSFQNMPLSPALQSLNSLEKGDFFASTRQFDRALEEYEKIIGNAGSADRRPFDWEKAVRSGLAISIRVKNDPDRALSIVEQVLKTPQAPYYFKEQATQWLASLKSWKAEPSAKANTEKGHYVLAVRLLADAKSLQKYPADRSADVLYLRASSAVHDLMSFAPNGSHSTEALYMAGLCYEVLHDLNLWDIHEYYYLACIGKSPHTSQARECFKHYEQSVYLGFTGSNGVHLPTEIRAKLNQLNQLSSPLKEIEKAPLQ